MIDRLPTPFGLVRFGVAPDHPKIKNVIRRYEKTAGHEAYRFFGNVAVGEDVSAEELDSLYHAVIWAYGAGADRKLGIPGEDLPGSHAATEFVAWYNGHPDYAEREFELGCERVVVIGNGNVAADVARMLVLPRDELEGTDTADHAIDALAGSEVREVLVLGRRGPAQAAFTNPEVRELGELTDADVIIDPEQAEIDEASAAFLESRQRRRHEPQERRELPGLRGGRASRRGRGARPQAEAGRAALPSQPCRDPGRGPGRTHRARRSTSSTSTRAERSAPARPARPRRSNAAWCCARSAIWGRRSTAFRTTRTAA